MHTLVTPCREDFDMCLNCSQLESIEVKTGRTSVKQSIVGQNMNLIIKRRMICLISFDYLHISNNGCHIFIYRVTTLSLNPSFTKGGGGGEPTPKRFSSITFELNKLET